MSSDRLVAALQSRGGIATTAEIRSAGVGEHTLRHALVERAVVRPRHGVVALATVPAPILAAAAAGGALACLSAAEHFGWWVPRDGRLHVSIRPNASRASRPEVVLHRDGHHLSVDERFVVSRQSCVAQCIRYLPFEHAVALLDSARHTDPARSADSLAFDLEALAAVLPRRLHLIIAASDPRAESGAESIARVRLSRAGLVVRPQHWVTGGIRVDLLIGDRLVVEIGSTAFHATPEQYEKDHFRATTLLALGFDVLEFTTRQVMDDWPSVEDVILRRAARLKSE